VASHGLSQFFGRNTDIASLPLSLLVEVGVVGFTGFYALLATVGLGLWRGRRTDPNSAAALAGIVGSGVAYIGVVGTSSVAVLMLVLGLFSAVGTGVPTHVAMVQPMRFGGEPC
jgi:hypothetical protein